MRKVSYALLAVIIADCATKDQVAKVRRDSAVVDSAHSLPSTVAATAPAADSGDVPLNADEVRKGIPDSADIEWSFAPRHDYEVNSIYSGRMMRRPSGVLRIWFDTATRATEEKPVGTVAVDSITANGLHKGEIFTTMCNRGSGNRDTQIVGVVSGRFGYDAPRLVWQLDTASKRIKALEPAGISCSAQDFDEVD